MSVNSTPSLETELGGVFCLGKWPRRGLCLLSDSAVQAPGHAVRMSSINHLSGTWASNTALLPPEEDLNKTEKQNKL